jgi:hypothetical protein
MDMTEPIRLADWIAALRAELTEAVAWQHGREDAAKVEGRELMVPPLKLKELKLEVEIASSRESKVGGGAKGGIEFWVVSAEVSGEGESRRTSQATQRVTLLLEPLTPLKLGSDDEKEILGGR